MNSHKEIGGISQKFVVQNCLLFVKVKSWADKNNYIWKYLYWVWKKNASTAVVFTTIINSDILINLKLSFQESTCILMLKV